MIVDSKTLWGWSYDKAKCCGMPHIGARYTADDVRRYEMVDGALCAVCGRPATDVHHEPNGRHPFVMRTEWGMFVLKPALIALCRQCHDKRHRHEVGISWMFDSDEYEAMWWDGKLLSHWCVPHSPKLFDIGKWVIS